MKKKILALILCVISLFTIVMLVSCGGEQDDRPSYTVTFDPAGGTIDGSSEITAKEGDTISAPNVSREGYTLTGWYSGKSKDTKWNFEKSTVTKDIKLTAWWTKQSGGAQRCEHEYVLDANKVNKQATCTESGKLNYICVKCTAEDYEIVTKLGHDLAQEVIAPTCGEIGYTREYCQRDGCTYSRNINEVYATGDHVWGDYETVIQATKYTDGSEKRTCDNCGAVQTFPIKAFYKPIDFKDLDIGNYLYTGGSYVNEPFVNISKYAGVYASNYYSVCLPNLAVDGNVGTYWSADTLVDGAKQTGTYFQISFSEKYDIGAFSVVLPFYSSWGLGDDCYVSYDVEAMVDGAWKKVAEFSDKTAKANGVDGVVLCELDEPVNTNDIRFVVTHSTRYSQAMIYEVEVLAKAPASERVPFSLVGSTIVTASGTFNEWGNTPSEALDGSNGTYWFTDSRHKEKEPQENWHEVYIMLDFSSPKFLAAVQLTVTANAGRKDYTIHYWDDANEKWVAHESFFAERNNCSNGGQYSTDETSGKNCTFLSELNVVTSKIKITEDSVNSAALSNRDYKVCEILPFTIIQQAKPAAMGTYQGCIHNYKLVDLNGDNKRNENDVIAPTCTETGYAIMECTKCGIRTYTDATDAKGHTWGDFNVETEATATTLGVKKATCTVDGCNATKSKNFVLNYDPIEITDFYHNANGAWAHTFDDGNYLETYEWVIPRLQEYHFRATIAMSITYVTQYVDLWNRHFATGTFDLGSHSYNHSGIYGASTNEQSFITDVNRAHYWFMSNFNGQKLLTFATPNGATSKSNAEFITGIMASGRNGGTQVMYNIMSNLTERQYWGNINSYISKADQTEGLYFFVKDGKFLTDVKYAGALNLNGSFGKPQTGVNDKGQPVYGEYGEWIEGANVLNNGGIEIDADGNPVYDNDYIVIKTLTGYVIKNKKNLADVAVQNYVYSAETNRLELSEEEGTYVYNPETYTFKWKTTGSYVDRGGELVYDENDNSGYKLYHVELGSYEKGINQLLDVEGGAWTVDCIHSLGWGSIYSSYASTMSKFEYLKQTGVWGCSYTDIVQYGKETQNATLDLISQTETEIKFELTDTLDDFLFDHALTIKVDIPDEWTTVTVMQGDKAIEFATNEEYRDDMTKDGYTIIDGYLYVDVVPDQGVVTITGTAE